MSVDSRYVLSKKIDDLLTEGDRLLNAADEDKAWKPAITIKQVSVRTTSMLAFYLSSFLKPDSDWHSRFVIPEDRQRARTATHPFTSSSLDLLDSPNADDPAQSDAFELFRKDKAQYECVYCLMC